MSVLHAPGHWFGGLLKDTRGWFIDVMHIDVVRNGATNQQIVHSSHPSTVSEVSYTKHKSKLIPPGIVYLIPRSDSIVTKGCLSRHLVKPSAF